MASDVGTHGLDLFRLYAVSDNGYDPPRDGSLRGLAGLVDGKKESVLLAIRFGAMKVIL